MIFSICSMQSTAAAIANGGDNGAGQVALDAVNLLPNGVGASVVSSTYDVAVGANGDESSYDL
jgi:hypothetical protein